MIPVATLSNAELKAMLSWLEADACINIFMPKMVKEEYDTRQFELLQKIDNVRQEDVLRGQCKAMLDIAHLHDLIMDEIDSRRAEKSPIPELPDEKENDLQEEESG